MNQTALIKDFKNNAQIGSLRFSDPLDDHPFALMGASQTWHLIHPGLEYGVHADVPLNLRFFEAARNMADRAMTAPENGKDYLLVSATAAMVYRSMLKYGTAGFMYHTQENDEKDIRVKEFISNLDTIIMWADLKHSADMQSIADTVKQSFSKESSKHMKVE